MVLLTGVTQVSRHAAPQWQHQITMPPPAIAYKRTNQYPFLLLLSMYIFAAVVYYLFRNISMWPVDNFPYCVCLILN